MRPGHRDLDDELRAHLALSVHERVARGEDPESARLAALRELGYLPAVRESIRSIWYSRWADAGAALGDDFRIAFRSLVRARGLAVTVTITLALGIGANAAVFSLVRAVLLRPLANRGEDRLVYIRQSAPGIGDPDTTFSVPEVGDFRSKSRTIGAFAEFSTIGFTLVGMGEPRVVQAGVVNGSYFDVMGLRPAYGRLLHATDDGAEAAPVAVLTHRFWTSVLERDPHVIGRTVRLGTRPVTIVGVLEPSVPYPAATDIIANVVSSPHHLGATMVTQRTHRMTHLFGRLAPGSTVEAARTELAAIHADMVRQYPDSYSKTAGVELHVTPLRDEVAAPARGVLIALVGAAVLVFLIAVSNVANLILARSVRRQGELAVRAALGASNGALRRTLLAESLLLCGAGAVVGLALASPLLTVLSRFAARFSVRALDAQVDSTLLWAGAGLALATAVLLAHVPRLPSHAARPEGTASPGSRLTPATARSLRIFATVQVAFSFVLLAGSGTLLAALVAIQKEPTGYDMQRVLAVDLPMPAVAVRNATELDLYERMARRIAGLPGVEGAALGSFVPWRDAGLYGHGFPFAVEGQSNRPANPHARFRIVSPGFFAVLGVPILAGRDFTGDDRAGSERVVIVSARVARELFPEGKALGRTLWWTDPYFGTPQPRRIVGIAADVDDESVVRGAAMTVYHPLRQVRVAGRLFVRASGDPYALVPRVREVVVQMSAEQPIERAATLEDVRAEVLAPKRQNALVLSAFAGTALLIAVVGVAGVLAFSVTASTRELGLRLAVGSSPRQLLVAVLGQGALIAGIGIAAGAAGGWGAARVAASYFDRTIVPEALPLAGAALVLAGAALAASLVPAARAARIDVIQALRTE